MKKTLMELTRFFVIFFYILILQYPKFLFVDLGVRNEVTNGSQCNFTCEGQQSKKTYWLEVVDNSVLQHSNVDI